MINKSLFFGDLLAKQDKNLVIPISIEIFLAKNGHLKNFQKNKKKISPIYFFKKNNIVKLEKEGKKINNIRGELGKLIQYFIKHKKINLVHELRTNFSHQDILSDFNYFTDSNFHKLYKKIEKEMKNKNISCEFKEEEELSENYEENNKINFNEFDNFDKSKLENYEIRYLVRGKYFVYPDSIPMIYEDNKEMPLGLKLYLKKYQK